MRKDTGEGIQETKKKIKNVPGYAQEFLPEVRDAIKKTKKVSVSCELKRSLSLHLCAQIKFIVEVEAFLLREK